MTETIFQIKHEEVKIIGKEILSLGYSIRGLAKIFGIDLRSSFYDRWCYRGRAENIEKLESILGHPVHVIKLVRKRDIQIVHPRDRDLSEMIGIMLGDGCILRYRGTNNSISVTLNSTSEKEYISYVEKLMTRVFGRNPIVSYRKDVNAANLILNGERYIKFLEEHGMKSGRKTIIQPGVPDWIKESAELMKSCLRGLVDTDGCVSVQIDEKRGINRICINFSNRSKPLLLDFKIMCNKIGINTNKIGDHSITILSRKDVKCFIDLVHPMKYETLISLYPDSSSLLNPVIDLKNDGSRCLYDRYTIEMLQNIARKRGGVLLSNVYEGGEKPLVWQCENKHIWHATPYNIVRKGTWCRKCAIRKIHRNASHKTISYGVKFKISKDELAPLVWEMPSTEIAKKYGVSDSIIVKRCKQLGIDKPGRGYWQKQRAKDQPVPSPPGDAVPASVPSRASKETSCSRRELIEGVNA